MTPVERRTDWPERLAAYLATARHQPFSWGRHDCALFACAAVESMTGWDPAARVRGRYASQSGAETAFRRYRVKSLEEIAARFAARRGCQEVSPAEAQRGDVVLLDRCARAVLGVVETSGRKVAAPGPDGLVLYPRALIRRAWRI